MPAPVRHANPPSRRTAGCVRAPRRDVEGPIHRSILNCLRAVLPHGAARTLHHSPNERLDDIERRKAAALGTKPGWPDLEWHGRLDDDTPYSAMIEVKAPKGSLSADQEDCHDALMDAGVRIGTARSIEDARAFLVKHRIPTRDMLAIEAGGSALPALSDGGTGR